MFYCVRCASFRFPSGIGRFRWEGTTSHSTRLGTSLAKYEMIALIWALSSCSELSPGQFVVFLIWEARRFAHCRTFSVAYSSFSSFFICAPHDLLSNDGRTQCLECAGGASINGMRRSEVVKSTFWPDPTVHSSHVPAARKLHFNTGPGRHFKNFFQETKQRH